MCSCRLVARHNETNAQIISKALQGLDDHHIGTVCNGVNMFHAFGVKATHE